MRDYLIGSDLISSSFEAPIHIQTDLLTPYLVRSEDVLGMIDIGAQQKQMNTLKVVPVSVANALLKGGLGAINQARELGTQNNLPGQTDRDNVYWKLNWHQSALAPLQATPNAIYASATDLQHWVLQAFIESNAAQEGANWIDAAWSQMWSEIGAAIQALPKEVAKQVGTTASDIVNGVTGLPIWAWGCIGGAVLILVGTFVYLLANTKTAANVSGIVAKTYGL